MTEQEKRNICMLCAADGDRKYCDICDLSDSFYRQMVGEKQKKRAKSLRDGPVVDDK